MTLGRLEFLYTPSDDMVADLRYLVDVLGGEQVFAVEAPLEPEPTEHV